MSIQLIENTNNFSLDPNEVPSTTETQEILKVIEPNKISSTNTDEEIEFIKKEALTCLEQALLGYKQKNELKTKGYILPHMLAPIDKLIESNIEKFNFLKYELLDEGVDLSCYEPLDVLLEGFSNRKLFSNMTNDQVQFLRDMVAKENKKLFNSSILYLAIGVSCFAVAVLLHARFNNKSTPTLVIQILSNIGLSIFAQGLVLYLSRKELKEGLV